MKKLKKLKLKKESILSLDRGAMKQIAGGSYEDCLTLLWPASCMTCVGGECEPDYPGNGSIEYCGTLNNCGTEQHSV